MHLFPSATWYDLTTVGFAGWSHGYRWGMAVRHGHPPIPSIRSRPAATAWTVSAESAAIGAAREHAVGWLAGAGAPSSVAHDAELVVSELVTNAVQASQPGAAIRIEVASSSSGWRISVSDGGGDFRLLPEDRRTEPLSAGGRGLRVVSRVASPPSVHQDADGWTTVSTVLPFGPPPSTDTEVTPGESAR
jgi:serine/threonine-protein kinase RsbW